MNAKVSQNTPKPSLTELELHYLSMFATSETQPAAEEEGLYANTMDRLVGYGLVQRTWSPKLQCHYQITVRGTDILTKGVR